MTRWTKFFVLPLAAALVAVACGGGDFDPSTKLESVRILGVRSDVIPPGGAAPPDAYSQATASYAKPGDTVQLTLLDYDARTDPTDQAAHPLKTYWIPLVCKNPKGDLYYACFAPGALDAGAGGSGGASGSGSGLPLLAGTDLTPFLKEGASYTVKVPSDIIATHDPVPGAAAPYGLMILFNMACAGHVQVTAIDPAAGPQAVPLGCFDDAGNALGPDEYVLGFSRIYVYQDRTNANPVISGVVVDGTEIDALTAITQGITVNRCVGDCPDVHIDVDVPASSQEQDPDDLGPDGNTRGEVVWVDYYATAGSLDGEARLLYDATLGRISGSEMKFSPPILPTPDDAGSSVDAAADGSDGAVDASFPLDDAGLPMSTVPPTLFAVVHDNRDGVAWLQIPLHVR